MKTKFNVGDKIKILLSAVGGGVSIEAVGKIGKITKYCSGGYFEVMMCDPTYKSNNPHLSWAVYPNQIEPVVIKGQQLLFSFMGE